VLHYLLIFYLISPDAVFHDVNERRQQWSQKMIAELNARPFQAVWVIILA